MKKEPLVSVIMSVNNGMPYLRIASASILNQSHRKIQFIIVDDASDDGSYKYLSSLKDERIILIRNSRNLGLAKSLNIALKKASGSFVARMDADDISNVKRIKEQLNFMSSNPKVDISGTWANLIDSKGEKIGEKKYPTKHETMVRVLPIFNPIIHPTFLVKTKVYEKLGGYSEDFDYAEDYDFLMRAKKDFRMANIPEILFSWRLTDSRRSRKQLSKMDQIDLRIKLDSLKRDGFSIIGGLAILKKLVFIYLFPIFLKQRIVKFLKLA